MLSQIIGKRRLSPRPPRDYVGPLPRGGWGDLVGGYTGRAPKHPVPSEILLAGKLARSVGRRRLPLTGYTPGHRRPPNQGGRFPHSSSVLVQVIARRRRGRFR